MQIRVVIIGGKTINLELEPSENFGDIKRKIEEIEGIPVEEQTIYYVGDRMENFSSLSSQGIRNNQTFHLVFGRGEYLQIFVHTLLGKTLTLHILSSYTVQDAKILIEKGESIPFEDQILVFAGKQLEDENLLVDYSIKMCTSIHLILRSYLLSRNNPK